MLNNKTSGHTIHYRTVNFAQAVHYTLYCSSIYYESQSLRLRGEIWSCTFVTGFTICPSPKFETKNKKKFLTIFSWKVHQESTFQHISVHFGPKNKNRKFWFFRKFSMSQKCATIGKFFKIEFFVKISPAEHVSTYFRPFWAKKQKSKNLKFFVILVIFSEIFCPKTILFMK